jgi:hypothetical protein
VRPTSRPILALRGLAVLTGAALLMLMLVSAPVGAQERDRAAAEALFRAGREAAGRGDYATACQRFEESNRLEPTAGTVMNLANCREQLGQIASAWQRYREAIEKLPAEDERVGIARERSAALEPRLPKLSLTLAASAPPETTVQRDEIAIGRGSFGVPLPVDPGAHTIVVRAPGRIDRRYELSLAEREVRELELETGESDPGTGVVTPPGEPRVDTGTESAPSSSRRTIGFVVGGIGLAGIAVSLTAGAMALSKKSEVDEECTNNRCTAAGLDAGDSGKTLVTVSNVAFVAGAVGIGLGAYLILSSDSTDERTARRARTPYRAALRAGVLPGGGSLRLEGRF